MRKMPRGLAMLVTGSLLGCLALTALAAALSGDDPPPPPCRLTIELVDSVTGKPLAGLVQIRDAAGKLMPLDELLARGFGLEPGPAIHDWSVVPQRTIVRVPQAKLKLMAFAGLETERAEMALDLTGREQAEVRVPLVRFYDAQARGFRSANTHLHLKQLSREQADRYLTEAPLGDGLDVVFLSYLERAVADLEYTSNKYTLADLHRLSHQGTQFGNGEEHRHNFTDQGQGYGHVMFLNIPELIQPVSIGPGITKQGTDGLPLKMGIEKAESFGSKIIWCHNQWGLEDIPSWVMGRLHANNIFDGGTHGSYKHSFYRYLNAGLKVPFSTGTDWFMYDFSRVYVPAREKLSPEQWLDVLAQGRSTITNGPLLEFRVNDRAVGETLDLPSEGKVNVEARVVGRVDFQRIELVRNGEAVRAVNNRAEAGHFVAEMKLELDVTEPCWLALRTPPPSVKNDPEFQTPVPKNEYGCDLFGHTSAIQVTLAGRGYFDRTAAQSLLKEMRESRHFIVEHAIFANDEERNRVLAVYDEAIVTFKKRIEEAKR
jgi:hypothetical protein